MFLSMPIKGSKKWDTDPTAGMIVDNRSFTTSQKLALCLFLRGLCTAVPARLSEGEFIVARTFHEPAAGFVPSVLATWRFLGRSRHSSKCACRRWRPRLFQIPD